MTIEMMSFADLEQVTLLASQLGYPNTLEQIQCRFKNINRSTEHALFVAKSEGKVLGYIQINLEPETLLGGPRADVAALIIDEKERSRGIGTLLLQEAEKWAHKKKLPLIRIRSNIKREDAHRFYKRNGYQINKSSHVFVKALQKSNF